MLPGAGLAAALLDLALPRACLVCGKVGLAWCPSCRPRGPSLRLVLDGVPVVARAAYLGALRVALLHYKERGRRDLTAPLAELLAEAVQQACGAEPPVLVPMPSCRAAVRERAGDHLLRLTRRCGSRLGLVTAPVLTMRSGTVDSAGLGAAQRVANLRGALRAAPAQGRPALVVDDIATSGASLRAAFAALRAAGWRIDAAAVIAATPSRAAPSCGGKARVAAGWQPGYRGHDLTE
jgi:predicted amidophosphoribosyltransferase